MEDVGPSFRGRREGDGDTALRREAKTSARLPCPRVELGASSPSSRGGCLTSRYAGLELQRRLPARRSRPGATISTRSSTPHCVPCSAGSSTPARYRGPGRRNSEVKQAVSSRIGRGCTRRGRVRWTPIIPAPPRSATSQKNSPRSSQSRLNMTTLCSIASSTAWMTIGEKSYSSCRAPPRYLPTTLDHPSASVPLGVASWRARHGDRIVDRRGRPHRQPAQSTATLTAAQTWRIR